MICIESGVTALFRIPANTATLKIRSTLQSFFIAEKYFHD